MLMPPPTVLTHSLSLQNGRSLPRWIFNVFTGYWLFRWCWMAEIYIPLKRCPMLDSLITVWDGLTGRTGLWILPCRMERFSCGQYLEIRKNLSRKTSAIAVYFLTLRKQKREILTY